ncbi:DNA-3-methyladenine glycosylase family protein [Aeromicrobium sp. CTD01-1L150]|uniref:DNA-3-methyladenine glycosylase family protein n=1 Tax=Aeromicrobium sp. CTD01-1L150 TaxID=3341830 RepID=UPI0035C072B5
MQLSRRLDTSEPVSIALSLAPLRRGPADPAVVVDDGRWWLGTRMATGAATLCLQQVGTQVIEAHAWGPGAEERLASLPDLLGAHQSPGQFPGGHPHVVDAARRFPGLRIPATGRVLEALVPAVLEQRVLGVDAFASWRRLLTAHGGPAPGPAPSRLRVPPSGEQWAGLASWQWHRAGVDPQRYRTAQRCARVAPQLERVAARGDHEATYRALRSIAGVGVWTAAEVGGRALGDTDAVPFGDYHLGHLVGSALLGQRLHVDDHAGIAEALEHSRPHRLVALRLLELSPHVTLERRGPRRSRMDHRAH